MLIGSDVVVSYPFSRWKAFTLLVEICDERNIRPLPDALDLRTSHSGYLDIAISRDSYICTVKVEDDTDTLDAPMFRSGCHALLDAYVSRAQGEPTTASIYLYRGRG